jgi:hypothetical protein
LLSTTIAVIVDARLSPTQGKRNTSTIIIHGRAAFVDPFSFASVERLTRFNSGDILLQGESSTDLDILYYGKSAAHYLTRTDVPATAQKAILPLDVPTLLLFYPEPPQLLEVESDEPFRARPHDRGGEGSSPRLGTPETFTD